MKPSEYILKSEREYALYVCRRRAIPYVGDGLKSSQRIALWLLRNRTEKIKTYALAGLMAYERLYNHGDASANNTISLLAAPYKNNNTLVQGLGQFGNRVAPDGDGIGAPRYTDVKRSKVAEELLYKDINLLPMEWNQEHSNQQPVHFLPLIPLVLLNRVIGVAVGWSTSILPYKLEDLINATKMVLKNKPVPQLIPYFNNYDVDVKLLKKNQWEITGKLSVNGYKVHITELPPDTELVKFKEHLINLEEKGYIAEFIDKSADNIDIIIDMKKPIRDAGGVIEPEYNVNKMSHDELLNLFKMRQKITERIVVIDWNGDNMKVYDSPEDVVVDFTNWRLSWYKKRYEKLIEDDNDELFFWKCIECLCIKKFPQKLGTHSNKIEMENEITIILDKNKIEYSEHHINRIVGLSTYRWTKELEEESKNKIAELNTRIILNTAIMNDPSALKKEYIDDLNNIDMKKL